jgi:hypothetical protein
VARSIGSELKTKAFSIPLGLAIQGLLISNKLHFRGLFPNQQLTTTLPFVTEAITCHISNQRRDPPELDFASLRQPFHGIGEYCWYYSL